MSMTMDFSFVIVGGGILGSALATLAAPYGLDPLVLRRPDSGSPHADTLRNQGWLQSGIMYPLGHFPDPRAYATFATRTYIAGRELLAMCGLPVPEFGGLLAVNDEFHREQLARKQELLRLSEDEFAQLEAAEARQIMGSHYEHGSTYYRIPDGPFNEAAVLSHFRDEATTAGAVFIEVNEPVRLERSADAVKVIFDGREITSPTVVVTAGAGSFELMQQCGVTLNGELQRTPLVVGDAPSDMPAPIMVDFGRGFSAVRHDRGGGVDAVVMGTRARTLPAPDPAERIIPKADQKKFAGLVPPGFQPSLTSGRYSAGYEIVPKRGPGPSAYEPWIYPDGPVIFGSPGRATVSALAAQDLFAEVIERFKKRHRHRRTTPVDLSGCSKWSCPIAMHYMHSYSYNDAEV